MLKKIFLAGALAPVCSVALAQDEIKAPSISPEESAYLAKESSLLRQLRLAQLEAKVVEAKGKTGQAAAGADPGGIVKLLSSTPPMAPSSTKIDLPQPPPPGDANASSSGGPDLKVSEIYGLDRALVATVVVGGVSYSKRAGDELSNGWRVRSIDSSRVVIAKGKRTKTVAVGHSVSMPRGG